MVNRVEMTTIVMYTGDMNHVTFVQACRSKNQLTCRCICLYDDTSQYLHKTVLQLFMYADCFKSTVLSKHLQI